MPKASTQTVSVTMRNVGTQTWPRGGQYQLGSQNPRDNTRWGINRVPVPHDVPPNADVTFTFPVQIRNAPGSQNFQWQMVEDGGTPFGQLTTNIEVKIIWVWLL